MSEHDASRREFLRRAAVGAGTVAGAGIVPEALAQSREQDKKSTPETNAPPHSQSNGEGLGAFLNRDDAATVAAFTERLMPGAPGKPGARDAGVLNYIDLALAGAYADLQDFYRRGLAQLDQYCRETHREPFVHLSTGQQDAVITALEEGKATGFTWPTAQACSPTRYTAATRTSPAGVWWASPALSQFLRGQTCRANRHSPARPSSACKPRPKSPNS